MPDFLESKYISTFFYFKNIYFIDNSGKNLRATNNRSISGGKETKRTVRSKKKDTKGISKQRSTPLLKDVHKGPDAKERNSISEVKQIKFNIKEDGVKLPAIIISKNTEDTKRSDTQTTRQEEAVPLGDEYLNSLTEEAKLTKVNETMPPRKDSKLPTVMETVPSNKESTLHTKTGKDSKLPVIGTATLSNEETKLDIEAMSIKEENKRSSIMETTPQNEESEALLSVKEESELHSGNDENSLTKTVEVIPESKEDKSSQL